MGKFFKNDSCDKTVIKKIQADMGINFPKSYIEFLSHSNGGEGKDNENRYVYIWRCEDIPQYNRDYNIQKYFPKDIIAFGMDGDYGYFFDYRQSGVPQIIGCAFSDLDIAEVKSEATTFEDFIKRWL